MATVEVFDDFPPPLRRPTEKQVEFFDACHEEGVEEILFSGAIRGGKTQAAAKVIASWAWTYGGTYCVMRKTYRELADSTQKAIIRGDGNMPPAVPLDLHAGGPGKGYRAKDEMLRLANGAEIIFRSCEEPNATIDKIKNVTMAGFFIDQVEELDSEDYWQLYQTMLGRLSHPGTPKRALLVANPSSEDHWVYRRFVDEKTRKDYTRCVHVTVHDNAKNLPARYVKNLERRRHDDEFWYRRYVLGEWGAFGGKRFKGWDPAIHMVDPFPIPPDWEIVEGIDFGWSNPTAVVWCAIDYEGRWWVIGDYAASERPISYHAAEIKRIREELGVSPSSVWLDPSAFAQRNQYESPAMEFFDWGIMCARAQNDRLGGWNRIEEMLYERMSSDDLPRLRVFNTCTHLPRELASARIKEGTDDIEKERDHNLDALRYAIVSRNPAPIRPIEDDADRAMLYQERMLARIRDRNKLFLGG